MASLLLSMNATITVAHSRTEDIKQLVKSADVVVAAVGIPEMVKGDWIKKNAIVIDVGINRNEAGKLCGDVDFAGARERAGYITPVPGGVGPLTIAYLLSNVVAAAKLRRRR